MTNQDQNQPQQNKKVGIYTKYATRQQLDQMSPTDNLVLYAKQLGWTDDQIVQLEKSASGKGIEELLDAIIQDEIGDVITYRIDRLFRDADKVTVDAFLQTCQEHNVRVITLSEIYDFSQDADKAKFRAACSDAFDYIQSMVYKRLSSPTKSEM